MFAYGIGNPALKKSGIQLKELGIQVPITRNPWIIQFPESANHSLESTIQALHEAKCIVETGKKSNGGREMGIMCFSLLYEYQTFQ